MQYLKCMFVCGASGFNDLGFNMVQMLLKGLITTDGR